MDVNRRDFLRLTSAGSLALMLDIMKPDLLALGGKGDSNAFPAMQYREYGQTGKKVSILGFGGMRFDSETVKKGNLEDPAKLLVEAYELGLNYFDTAPNYVNDKSEEIFGLAIKEIDRKRKEQSSPLPYYVTSKSGIWMDPTASAVRQRLEKSLKRMGKDKLNFYHMWCFQNYQHYREVMKPGGPYEGAVAAKKEGLIDHIVFSSHASSQETIRIIGDGVFEGMLIGYNMVNFPKQDKAVQAAVDKKMGVVIMNPLAGGMIPRHQDYFRRMISPDGKGITLVQTALNFIMGQPGITVTLPGIANREQLHENVRSLQYLEIFGDQRLAALKKQYLKRIEDFCTTCQYCKVCPVDIPVWTVMDCFNDYILGGREAARKSLESYKRDDKLDIKAEIAKCTKCGACEEACTQHLPIVKRFEKITAEF